MTAALAAALPLVLVLSACGVRGLNFRQDDRVTITVPSDRAEVDVPVTVAWRVRDFEITGRDGFRRRDAGYFGVFVDRAPQPPDRTQEWLVRDDQLCRSTPGCPDEAFLAQQDILSTTRTSVVLERLPDLAPNDPQRDFHEVTIVLLNGRGERIGESAFTVQFEVRRED